MQGSQPEDPINEEKYPRGHFWQDPELELDEYDPDEHLEQTDNPEADENVPATQE